MVSEKVEQCAHELAVRNWAVAFAESATAGKMSYLFSLAPDSGKVLLGGIVCYNASVKEELLDIEPELIQKYTAESAETTRAMAVSLCRSVGADVCVALTGLTAPGGSETEEKPVGTIFAHIIYPDEQMPARFYFEGTPESIVDQAIGAVCEAIIEKLRNSGDVVKV